MCDEFDGRVLNPSGVEIEIPYWVFKRLKRLHLLGRDPVSGRRMIRKNVFGLMEMWDAPEFAPKRRLQPIDPGSPSSRPKDGGRSNAFAKSLGRDCSGLVNPAFRRKG
jgi:hypothetical protein